ncbi:CAP domain-containing protein [Paraburkholderia sp. BCC1876]|uniref:CAP domain-containing protein n=1 Tax=Paraburkholderia sp. BCC1876 TaxID=2676303 RepID=UPI001591BA23|nr:CAP domain-containing protein [Paraburkholderia sp. BCC1876]
MTNKKIGLTALSLAAAMLLAACGGGGGGSSSTAPAGGSGTPPATASGATTPQTSVPAPTYAANTMQQATFAQLNAYRLAMGVGQLSQDPLLDTSAQAHALYLDSNLANGNLTALSHNETSSFANYYGDTPLSRAQKAGTPVTEWIGEVVAAGLPQSTGTAYATDCLRQYINTVYHLQSISSPQQTMGIGFQQSSGSYPIYSCVIDFGQTAGVTGTPLANAVNTSAGQQLPIGAIVTSPLNNETGVAIAMVAENINPAPDIATPGRPIMVRVNAANQGDVLTVTSFTLTTAAGVAVPARIIVPSAALTGSTSSATADVNNGVAAGVAFLLPLAPLAANTTYNWTFNGARDGSPVSIAKSFVTGS